MTSTATIKELPMSISEQPVDFSTIWQSLCTSASQPRLWLALAQDYARHALPWQAGYAARQAARFDPGLRSELDALGCAWEDVTRGDGMLGHPTLDEAAALAEKFAARVEHCADDWLSWLYLVRLREMQAPGAVDAVAVARAIACEVVPGESLHWLGVWRLHAGDTDGAVTALSRLVDMRPIRFGSMMFLGEALLRQGNVAGAEKSFARASLSSNPGFLLRLSSVVFAHNYWMEAIEILEKALTFAPRDVALWLALARIHSEVYQLAECRACLQKIKSLQPENREAKLLEAGLQGRMGDARGHLTVLQDAYENGGDPLSRLASSVAMTSLYQDQMTPAMVADLHRRLCAPIMAALTERQTFANTRSQTRRLRIGYVTGDTHRQHPVNIFILPILQRHSHTRFEIVVYHTGTMHDAYTRQAMASVDRWREANQLDDVALQQLIVQDGIDILIDLAGHTSTHRLGVFALRAAPVQATFLGYPHSTGLSTIDWIIADAIVAPAAHAALFSERICQLPGSVFCWSPVDEYPLPPARPDSGPVVFGSFNNAMKLTPQTIALWARVLLAVPDALLLLKAPSLRDAAVQARFTGLFAEHGVAADRLQFRGPTGLEEMMQEYGDIDIALDPTPYNGGTTTLQALWMGVPVVTLLGGNFVSRMGASFLTTLGRPEWVAEDGDAFVAIAASLASQIRALRSGRPALREAMQRSRLCDIDTYVADFEAGFVRMWKAYCKGSRERVMTIDASVPVSSMADV